MSQFVSLFDLDGTLTNADHLHFQAFNDIMGPYGKAFSFDQYLRDFIGKSNREIFHHLLPELPVLEQDRLANAKEARFRQLGVSIKPLDGLIALLNFLRHRKIACGVVTNAPVENADFELKTMQVADYFQIVVLGSELEHPKPHPMPYLKGLRQLDGRADISLAFEDSISGMTSALAAGLTVIGVATNLTAPKLIAAGAHMAVEDYRDERIYQLIELRQRLAMA